VDMVDYSRLTGNWMATGCHEPDWCDGADIDWSGRVDWADLKALALQWLD